MYYKKQLSEHLFLSVFFGSCYRIGSTDTPRLGAVGALLQFVYNCLLCDLTPFAAYTHFPPF